MLSKSKTLTIREFQTLVGLVFFFFLVIENLVSMFIISSLQYRFFCNILNGTSRDDSKAIYYSFGRSFTNSAIGLQRACGF